MLFPFPPPLWGRGREGGATRGLFRSSIDTRCIANTQHLFLGHPSP
ncbi:hypothetical protein ABIB90_004950 [Bradyrhizobium sp. JR4.1]|nr:hypothetical protein Bra1253DRAFT_05153 [Bradyrhizobium sp. WSM1253]